MVTAYLDRSRQVANQDILKTLSPLEQKLAEKLDMIEVLGKRKRRVPVIITPYVKAAIDTLVLKRNSMGLAGNQYLFAKAGSKTYLPGWKAVKLACEGCSLKEPHLITSTKMRKYLATVTQVMQLDNQELEWVANHLGHNLEVHRSFYRLPNELLQVAKVSQLLLASEQGRLHQYADRSLQDINVEGNIAHLELVLTLLDCRGFQCCKIWWFTLC